MKLVQFNSDESTVQSYVVVSVLTDWWQMFCLFASILADSWVVEDFWWCATKKSKNPIKQVL
jgi:hypothetical protein